MEYWGEDLPCNQMGTETMRDKYGVSTVRLGKIIGCMFRSGDLGGWSEVSMVTKST